MTRTAAEIADSVERYLSSGIANITVGRDDLLVLVEAAKQRDNAILAADSYMRELTMMKARRDAVLAACKESLPVLECAIRAGCRQTDESSNFTDDEDEELADH